MDLDNDEQFDEYPNPPDVFNKDFDTNLLTKISTAETTPYIENEHSSYGNSKYDPESRFDSRTFARPKRNSQSTAEMIYFVPHNLHLENARLNCRYSKGNLATIRSHLDNTLAAKVMLMRGLGDKCAFIGFTDEKSSGIWRWMNGRPVTYTNWAYHRTDKGWDQPNDGFGYGKEDYTAMCRWSNTLYNPRNEFKWFDVGPPRNYFGTTVNFELAYSFCSASANFVASTKNCKRPLRPCGGYYINEKKVIEHGKSTFVYCNRGYWLQGNEEVTCNNGVTSPVPKCIRIYYERDGNAVVDQSVESSSVPRVQLQADAEPGDMRDNCVRADDAARTGNEYIIVESEKEVESGEDSIPRTG